MTDPAACPLCHPDDETVLWKDETVRIILVGDHDYPGFCRVVLNRHVKEMTDLSPDERDRVMRAVFAVESGLRELFAPDKINLASLGNQVPHLHWHVIPRYRDDRHFPDPVWSAVVRPGQAHTIDAAQLGDFIGDRLGIS